MSLEDDARLADESDAEKERGLAALDDALHDLIDEFVTWATRNHVVPVDLFATVTTFVGIDQDQDTRTTDEVARHGWPLPTRQWGALTVGRYAVSTERELFLVEATRPSRLDSEGPAWARSAVGIGACPKRGRDTYSVDLEGLRADMVELIRATRQ